MKKATFPDIKFCLFNHYFAGLFEKSLSCINFPNYQNFNETTDDCDYFIQEIMVQLLINSNQNVVNEVIIFFSSVINILVVTLHEKQHFRKNAEHKYHIFVVFRIWRKYSIFRKTKIKENIIFSIISGIFRNKSIKQDNDQKKILKD